MPVGDGACLILPRIGYKAHGLSCKAHIKLGDVIGEQHRAEIGNVPRPTHILCD